MNNKIPKIYVNKIDKNIDNNKKESEQKQVIGMSLIIFILGFIIAGLDFRYNWVELPNAVTIIATIIFVLSYMIYAEVLRENSFLSRTICVQNNQKVIETGLYGIVRHPMYTATIFLFLSIPLILGSAISFIVFLIYPFIIVKRLNNEENVLEQELAGYKEYKKKVKYKMIPFIW